MNVTEEAWRQAERRRLENERRLRLARRLQILALILSLTALVLSVAAVVASSAHGASLRPVQNVSVVNRTGVPAARVASLERAVQRQVNRQLDAWWYGRPHIRFVPAGLDNGWLVTIVTGRQMVKHGYCGYHGPVVLTGNAARKLPRDVGGPSVVPVPGLTPYAVVGLSTACDTEGKSWSIVFSHEVMEMVVDPWPGSYLINGKYPEVGDPVNGIGYPLLGVRVSDFVTPAYFWQGRGRYDQLGIL